MLLHFFCRYIQHIERLRICFKIPFKELHIRHSLFTTSITINFLLIIAPFQQQYSVRLISAQLFAQIFTQLYHYYSLSNSPIQFASSIIFFIVILTISLDETSFCTLLPQLEIVIVVLLIFD